MNNATKSTLSMILGILSIVFFEIAIIGLVCSIFAMILAKQASDDGGKNNMNTAGKITGTIGLIISCVIIDWVVGCVICSSSATGINFFGS